MRYDGVRRSQATWLAGGLICALMGVGVHPVHGQERAVSQEDPVPERPAILFNRWQEDWSVLADPRVPREPFDELKYIPFSASDPLMYLSLGADFRSRFEWNDAPEFGTGPNRSEAYVITRTEVDVDLHLGPNAQVFTQLQSDWATWKKVLLPPDQDRLGLEQAFVLITEPVDEGTVRLRLGRQQFAFDLQRFVSSRDGPNVRQSYDGAWAEYQRADWKYIAFYTHPVETRGESPFDDYSGPTLTFSGFRIEREEVLGGALSAYYAHFTQDNVHFLAASGNDRRNILDAHYAGVRGGFDWDLEGMDQRGTLGPKSVRAWGIGTLAGSTFQSAFWSPRIGLQVDAASGTENLDGQTVGTFNPLFPNGYYLQLAAYTGYVNFIHVKPSLTLHPRRDLTLLLAVAAQWRQTTADGVYVMPDIPVVGTAGEPGRYTGTYAQTRVDWAISPNAAFAVELDHFIVGDVLERVGGHDSNYAGIEIKYGW
jgi:hypothetical protein